MKDMTWGDFLQLALAAGVQESDTIDWFDFSYPSVSDQGAATIEVFRTQAPDGSVRLTIH